MGRSGRFEGNIKAERLLVSGFVEGVIDCVCMEIVAEGRVFGELHSDDFIIEPGGQFLGESHPRREIPLTELRYERSDEPQLSGPGQEDGAAEGQNSTAEPTEAGHREAPRPGFEAGRTGREDDSASPRDSGDEASSEDGQVNREPRRTTWGRR